MVYIYLLNSIISSKIHFYLITFGFVNYVVFVSFCYTPPNPKNPALKTRFSAKTTSTPANYITLLLFKQNMTYHMIPNLWHEQVSPSTKNTS